MPLAPKFTASTATPLHCSTASLSQSAFMEIALQHPTHGYYRTHQAVGQDFTTAPEISQIFGELLGGWVIDLYTQLGSPSHLNLVELGPGHGTLMADLLRVAKPYPAFLQALQIHLVEINPHLKQLQQEKIYHPSIQWHETIDTLPSEGPLLILANEFFDVLPTNCYVRQNNILYERQVSLKDGQFTFILHPLHPDSGEDRVWEESPAALTLMKTLGQKLLIQGGALLGIDYGYETGQGDTLQALFEGAPSSPLDHVGRSDLTCHVNFGALKQTAIDQGLSVFGPIPQGTFLKNLGIDLRASVLKNKNQTKASMIAAACERLTHPQQMGSLFKTIAVVSPSSLAPLGFES